jgi:hypothetical protein
MSRGGKGGLDLLGQARREAPPEAPSGSRPGDEAWRADALARSRHSRLDDLPHLAAACDEATARSLCAELCRQALGDFAPALLLLGGGERRRVRALAAYAFTLFDFARQRGVEGERLAAINRWQFTLEAVLAGEPAGQPVFVAMAAEQRRRPWPAAALDELAAVARARVSVPLPATPEAAAARRRRLAVALAGALLAEGAPEGRPPAAEPAAAGVVALGAALLAVRSHLEAGEEMRQLRSPVSAAELAPEWARGAAPTPEEVAAAVRASAARLRSELAAPGDPAPLPPAYRRALGFLRRAAGLLLDRLAERDESFLGDPPRLGLGDRLRLLVQARWGAR